MNIFLKKFVKKRTKGVSRNRVKGIKKLQQEKKFIQNLEKLEKEKIVFLFPHLFFPQLLFLQVL